MNIRSSRILYSTMWSSHNLHHERSEKLAYRCRRRRAVRRPVLLLREQATTPTASRRPPSCRRRRRYDHSRVTSLHSLQTEEKRLNQMKIFPYILNFKLIYTVKLFDFLKIINENLLWQIIFYFSFQ